MSQTFSIQPAKTDEQIKDIADLAEIIWNQHFTPIIGKGQVDYMVEKFQSFPAIKDQITKDGYEYFEIFCDDTLAGYTGIHAETGKLFLSKLCIHPDFRGRHLATKAFQHLIDICKERGLKKIWLTCNKHNDNTLKIYDHLGLQIYTGIHAETGKLFLSKLCIHPDFRGRHLATKAFQHLIDICKERGLKKIWLTCNKHNDNTLKIYDHLGLQITDSQVADIGNGFVMDDYILTYEI